MLLSIRKIFSLVPTAIKFSVGKMPPFGRIASAVGLIPFHAIWGLCWCNLCFFVFEFNVTLVLHFFLLVWLLYLFETLVFERQILE